ncbi:phosphotransferase [Dactylosporangium sp. NPDC050688]|uniref:phosphotransferase n=1 Tax=Dactylosporangium sp. NPDC050688 TaxID=3157217 RepID=UPI0033D8944A
MIAKLLTTDDPYWTDRRTHEVTVYRAFESTPPPFPVPQLIAHDDRLALYTVIPGVRLGDERHLTADVPAGVAAAILDALDAVRSWTPRPPLAEPIPSYPTRIDAEHAAGLLTDADHDRLQRLQAVLGPARWTSHGDPIPSNLLLHDGTCSMIDWELCGRFLPGYDHAVLHTVTAAASPTLAAAIDARVATLGITDAYLVNLGIVLCREIRIHRTLPSGPVREQRLAALDHLCRQWRHRLQSQTG